MSTQGLPTKQALKKLQELGYIIIRENSHYVLKNSDSDTITLPHTGRASSWLSNKIKKMEREVLDNARSKAVR